MPIEVSYHPGDCALLGQGDRWLLLKAPVSEVALLRELWEIVTSAGPVQERILSLVADRLGPDTSLVWVDGSTRSQSVVTRGSGRCIEETGRWTLRFDESAPPAEPGPSSHSLPLASGIVLASSAAVSRGDAAPAIPGLIDGIPASVLKSVSVTPQPPAVAVAVAVADDSTDRDGLTTRRPPPPLETDHDGHTTFRPASTRAPAPTPAPDHLTNATHETVLAVHCPAGHTTPAAASHCRVCLAEVPAQDPRLVPRPRLGHLRLPDGSRIPLDRAVLFGRSPSAPDVPELGEAWPHLVTLPSETSFVSRTHLLVELKGWLVLVTDLGSRGGTILRAPGRAPERIRAREHYIWEPGQAFDLADSYEIRYEVTSS